MSVGRIRIFAATSLNRSSVLRMMGQSGQRLNLNCAVVDGWHYLPCEVAVVWSVPKTASGALKRGRRQMLRHEIFTQHKGRIVVIEAPVLGRSVQHRKARPWLVRKLLPEGAAWTPMLRPKSNATHDPFAHYRIGFGAFPDQGALALGPYCPGRWQTLSRQLGLPDVSPYREQGEHIIVIGQVNGDASLRGQDINDWILASCTTLRGLTDRPIMVRPHPLAADFEAVGLPEKLARLGVSIDNSGRSFSESLRKAWSVVTYSSGAAVDALLAGIPAISMSPASFAWAVTDHALERALEPTLFDRTSWLDQIAASQWCEAEIASGEVWEPLLQAIAADTPRPSLAHAAE
jgi:hypothetical protein